MAPGERPASSSAIPPINEEEHTRRVRGPTRGSRLESLINARDGQRIHISLSDVNNVPNDDRRKLRQHFDKFATVEEAKRNPHKNMNGERASMWEKVCNVCESPRFKRRSVAGKIGRAANRGEHLGGSRRFQTLANRRARESGMEHVSQVEIYKETHHSTAKGWIRDSGENYQRMIEIQSQPTLEGSQPLSDMEIFSQVLGERPGYCRSMGAGPKPPKASRAGNSDSTLRRRLENAENELAEHKARSEIQLAECTTRMQSFEKMMRAQREEMMAYML